jgi:hypothetical protein
MTQQKGKISLMKLLQYVAFSFLLTAVSVLQAQSPATGAAVRSDKDKFIGAWHLAHIDSPGSDGNAHPVAQPKGMLLYTRDGHMSVQLMYPDSAANLTNEYVLNGYEASFGSYELDEAKHLVTHHVQGSITHGLVGKDLSRVYQFTDDGHLIIRSASPAEHWSVTWEHY